MPSASTTLLKASQNSHSRVISWILAVIFIYLMASLAWDAASLGERTIWVRYLNFVLCGFFAFVIPHFIFPDPKRYLLQSFNLSPKSLLHYAVGSIKPLLLTLIFGIAVLSFFEPANITENLTQKGIVFLSGSLFLTGIGFTSLFHYCVLGRKSQEWQEGTTGEKIMKSLKNTGAVPSMPPGSFPSIATTTLLATIGMLMIVGGAYITQITGFTALEMLPGLILTSYTGIRFALINKTFDSFYYHTNAFYSELFMNPRAVQEGREPVQFKALYWVPSRWKTGTWFSLLQLDRKQPLGRLLIVAHLLLWMLFYSGLSDMVITVFITLIILGKCMAVYRLISKPFAPLLFQYRLLPPADWIVVRFFVNIRWIPLLALSLWLVSLFTDRVDSTYIFYWLVADIIISFISAVVFTRLHEFRIKTIYA